MWSFYEARDFVVNHNRGCPITLAGISTLRYTRPMHIYVRSLVNAVTASETPRCQRRHVAQFTLAPIDPPALPTAFAPQQKLSFAVY